MKYWAALLICLGTVAAAQEPAARGTGAVLRILEKVNGQVDDVILAAGASKSTGRLTVRLWECRYPVGNPTSDAYAFIEVTEEGAEAPVFSGWMVASSPALNAMEHPRYDVWVLRCNIE